MPSATGIWRREGDVARPIEDQSLAFLRAHADGEEFIAETSDPRNLQQLKLWWCLMQLLSDNDPTFPNRYVARDSISMKLGFVDYLYDWDTGLVKLRPKSIAVQSMPQAEFNELFRGAVNLIAERLGNLPEEISREANDRFNQMVADKRYEGYRR